MTLKSTRAISDNGRTWCTRWPVHTVAGLCQANMRRIAFDHIDIDTPRDWTYTVRDEACVLRGLLNVVDLQYAAIWVKILPHCRRCVRLKEHPIPCPAVAQLSVAFDIIVARREAAHAEGVATLQSHACRINTQPRWRLDVNVERTTLLDTPVCDL